MKIAVWQHVEAEGPGLIAVWAAERGHEIELWRAWRDHCSPPLADAMVVMGGPMGADDEAEYAWLATEKAALGEAVAAGLPALGVCLGAQLLARVLGAAVTRNAVPEIGWWPVTVVADHPWMRGWPPEQPVLHWHGDTFAIPDEAVCLLASQRCRHQAFVWRDRVLGLQFHLEQDAATLAALLAAENHNQGDGDGVQSADELRAGMDVYGAACRALLWPLLDAWIARAA